MIYYFRLLFHVIAKYKGSKSTKYILKKRTLKYYYYYYEAIPMN